MRTEQFLTVEEAARLLRLEPSTIRRQLRVGTLRGVKRGHIWRVPESALSESRPTVAQKPDASKTESPFEKALALVAQLENQMQGKPKRISGVNDAVTEIRQIREEQAS